MADNKTVQDGRDRAKVSGSDDYEVAYFAKQAGISSEQARSLIATHGNDRKTLMDAAKRLKH